eukprot:362985-Amphidinium_carterae.1
MVCCLHKNDSVAPFPHYDGATANYPPKVGTIPQVQIQLILSTTPILLERNVMASSSRNSR